MSLGTRLHCALKQFSVYRVVSHCEGRPVGILLASFILLMWSLLCIRSAPGLEETAESSSGGESGGGKRASVQEMKVSGSSAAKWQPVSEEASKMLSNAMLSALG